MTFKEFEEILAEDSKKCFIDQRMSVVLDFHLAVYGDRELETYWFYDPDEKEVIEVEIVAHLQYCVDRDRLCDGMDENEDMGAYLTDLIDCRFCGESLFGDWLWFDDVDKENPTPRLKHLRVFN